MFKRSFMLKLILILCILATFLFILLFFLFKTYETIDVVTWHPPYNVKTTKFILIWKKFTWEFYPATLSFSIKNTEKKCIFTNKHDFLPVDKFNAIVFHTGEQYSGKPNKRHANQSYVFANVENPVFTKHDIRDENNFYNLTMTYRLDSDLPWTYGIVRDKETKLLVAPMKKPIWREPDLSNFVLDAKLQQLINGKTKSIAWFASHCSTPSRREYLTEELKNHFTIDIYGDCGELSCPIGGDECNDALDKHYKFYLSFENTLCIDYVTEKLYRNALNRLIIPIVYGGVDYNRFAPPHSYIDAQDFENVEELAKYLKYLERNTTAYGEYFWWKSYYILDTYNDYKWILCHYLHDPLNDNKIQYYGNIYDHWVRGCTTKARIKFPVNIWLSFRLFFLNLKGRILRLWKSVYYCNRSTESRVPKDLS